MYMTEFRSDFDESLRKLLMHQSVVAEDQKRALEEAESEAAALRDSHGNPVAELLGEEAHTVCRDFLGYMAMRNYPYINKVASDDSQVTLEGYQIGVAAKNLSSVPLSYYRDTWAKYNATPDEYRLAQQYDAKLYHYFDNQTVYLCKDMRLRLRHIRTIPDTYEVVSGVNLRANYSWGHYDQSSDVEFIANVPLADVLALIASKSERQNT
jgi:hypothetical protein